MDGTTSRSRLAAIAAAALLATLLLPASPASASAPSVACDAVGDVLTVTLTAGEAYGMPAGAATRIAILDRSGTVGFEDGLASGVWVSCGVAVGDLTRIRVVGSSEADEVVISEEGPGRRSYGFPATVDFEVDLSTDGEPAVGDLLVLALRPEGGALHVGDGTFALGAATGTFANVETAELRVGYRRAGTGPATIDAHGATIRLNILGGRSADLLLAGSGDDFLSGAEGADVLDGGAGEDAMNGGPGRDRCTSGEDIASCEAG